MITKTIIVFIINYSIFFREATKKFFFFNGMKDKEENCLWRNQIREELPKKNGLIYDRAPESIPKTSGSLLIY